MTFDGSVVSNDVIKCRQQIAIADTMLTFDNVNQFFGRPSSPHIVSPFFQGLVSLMGLL